MRRLTPTHSILTIVGLATVIGLVILLWRGFLLNQRASNERAACAALKMIVTAEAEFWANELDGDGVKNWWTGDVAGLFYFRRTKGQNSPEIQLIPREIAYADAEPLKPLVRSPIPYHGYLFRCLKVPQSSKVTPRIPDTGASQVNSSTGKIDSAARFGFVAYPVVYGDTGRFSFVIDSSNLVTAIANDGHSIVTVLDSSSDGK